MQELISIINSIYPISKELVEHLLTVLKRENYQKGAFLLKAGHVSNRLIFVEKGLLRCFLIEDEKEYTIGFFPEGEIPISLQSFESRTPSIEFLEALEDTTIIYLAYEDLLYIFAHYPEANQVGRIIFTKSRNRITSQLNDMKMRSAAERYAWFVNQFPQLVQRVPGKYIASYLGMTEFTLSRIRGAYNG